MSVVYVASIEYYDPADSTVKTTRVATVGFTTGASDTPAHTTIPNRVANPALLRRDVFDVGTTGGASRVGYGELVLTNTDGGLDWLNDVGLDGRTLTIYVGAEGAAFPAGFTTLLVGTMEQVDVSLDVVRVRIRDRQVFVSKPLQVNKYGGTNLLPDGVDGIDSDLRGKPKPVCYGWCLNIPPVCVNTSRLIYQVNDGAVRDILAVYDAGALLTPSTDYTDQADMEANAPSAGTYRKWKDGGMFRLGSSPYGQVTADVVEGAYGTMTAGQIFSRLLQERAGRDPSDISSDDVDALDAAQSAVIGVYFADEVQVATALDVIAQSVGAWWASDVAGVLRIQRLDAPSGDPVLSLTAANLTSLARVPLADGGLPVYRVTVRCVPNNTVQTTGLVGSVTQARRARLAQPYQDASDTDMDVQTTYLLAPEKIVETRLACLSAGATEASRLLSLYSTKRDRLEVQITAPASTLALIDLGVVVSVTFARYNLDGGKLFRVLGYQLDPTAGVASLTLWG